MVRALSTLIADGTEHTNSTDEAVLASYTVKSNTFQKGKIIRITFMARVTDNNSTDTLTCKVRIGATTLTGTAVITTSAVDVADDDVCVGWVEFICRDNPSTTAAIIAYGQCNDPDASGQAAESYASAQLSLDTTADLLIELTGDWSVAHADNQVQAEVFNVFEIAA